MKIYWSEINLPLHRDATREGYSLNQQQLKSECTVYIYSSLTTMTKLQLLLQLEKEKAAHSEVQ